MSFKCLNSAKKMQPVIDEAIARPAYIHMTAGSFAAGVNASARAEPKALVSKYIDCTKDFMLGGALVYAYSRPETLRKISDKPMKTYAGVWMAI